MDKFPTALNMPMPLKNMTHAFSSGTAFSSSFISPERLDELQQTVDIVSVMESYGLPRFSRSGQFRATCLCPFHDDRNPSLSIDGVRGIYKCFSCGAGGNVFSFVREYSKIQGDELSFSEAVKFVESQFAWGDSSMILEPGMKSAIQIYNGNRTAYNATCGMKASAKVPRGFQASRNRIFMVNAAAAAFYGQCLGVGYAGRARSHLRARGMQPRTIRAFSMGYAPDAYFSQQGTWGEGSLVEYLQRKGFTTTEIVDGGLATILKKDAMKIEIQQEKDKNFQIPYSSLMDRFRGRLMVPIFDASGVHVLGFGGRVLDEGFTSESESVSGPKYLNSPESPVFQKKNILFGQHMATMALRFWDKEEHIARAVVVVEGYMDAIALWQYGVREAVACMGTGLTEEQITAAAILAGDKNGRVIFCLDNDDAGIAAVERICRSGILATVSASHPVEFRVARLPDKVKDPADYLDLHKGDSKPDEAFRLEVLESNSLHWMDWFQHRTLTQYNSTATKGEKWSFSDVMDRLGALLSMIKKSSERKARFDDIVDILLNTLAKDNEQGGVSGAVQLQIQSELERKISIMSRTTKSVSVGALAKIERSSDELSKTLARMAPTSGDLPPSSILPRVPKLIKDNRRGRQRSSAELGPFQAMSSNTNIEGDIPPRRRFRSKNMPKQKASLTPHFSGFRFQNKHDAAWFGDDDFTVSHGYVSMSLGGVAVQFTCNASS
jgi:DNA primase catalytic core